ncbi:sulfatase [Rubritalea spongiae]|uniref:Sulfatase n=1 Tax=Rubritalea spongiae TaxID=430797 RepID=A0ABW5E425_9BACT
MDHITRPKLPLIRSSLTILTLVCLSSLGLAEKPNILWIYAEDQSPLMSCYGVEQNPTPHIDKLAKDGVLFTRAFMPAPVCSATRSALITGCMQTSLGIHNHRSSRTPDSQIQLPAGVRTLPELFKAAGYFTFNQGKDDYNFSYDRQKLYNGEYKKNFAQGHSGLSISFDTLQSNQPFFGQIQLKGGKSRAKITSLDPDSVTLPPYYPNHPEIRKIWARHHDTARVMDREVGEIIAKLKENELLENTIVFVFSDHGWNNGLRDKQFCYDGGLHVPLTITWYGKPEAINSGKARTDLVNGIDISSTSLALAGISIPEYMEGENLFAPDFHRDFVIGARDRCDFTIDRIRTVRTDNFRYIRNGLTDRPYMQPQYRDTKPYTKLLKQLFAEGKLNEAQAWFFAPHRPAEELYDLQSDPYQTRNIATDPDYAEELKKHRKILDQWIIETKDRGQEPESAEGLRATMKRWKGRCVNPEYQNL